jgi:hypothetical protein
MPHSRPGVLMGLQLTLVNPSLRKAILDLSTLIQP